jgi:glyoxylase-like metal-dependent hydrolase (beta-lactamase superfamily II)
VTTWLCVACGTQYPPAAQPPAACPICDDQRQYVPREGQQWLTHDEFVAGHRADIRDDHGVLGIGNKPEFAIGQRALLVETPNGNVLWDCIAYLDDELVAAVEARGGLAGIAVSHPHFYTAMVDWAHAFGCPVHLHEAERDWVMRPDPSIRFWRGETDELLPGVELIRCGGHFDGGQVLHWADRRALLTSDIVTVVADTRYVSFMHSYPNLIPLPPSKVAAIGAALEGRYFETIYGGWWGRVIGDGASAVRRSVERYLRAVADPGLPS